LLARIQRDDPAAWSRFCDVYGPVVYRWARRTGLQPQDAADVVQNVFCSVTTAIGDFRHGAAKASFRGWLHTITRRKIVDLTRINGRIPKTAGDMLIHSRPDLEDAFEESATDASFVTRRVLELIQIEFEETTWRAFWRTAVDGASGADVARDLGLSVGAVYKAKSRVLRRVRDELEGLL
jgi:RNA polymerase sigma-70 factor (ECF subfamily)